MGGAVALSCVQCGIAFTSARQYVYQGDWRHKPQCRAWRRCEQRKADRVIRRLEAEGKPVPDLLRRWGALLPDKLDRAIARERVAKADVQAVLTELGVVRRVS